jgi:hypothetical protein
MPPRSKYSPYIMPAFDRSFHGMGGVPCNTITGTCDAARRRSHGQAGRGARLHARMRGQKESLLIRPSFPPNATLSAAAAADYLLSPPLFCLGERERQSAHTGFCHSRLTASIVSNICN